MSWGEQIPTHAPTTYSRPSSRTHTCNSLPLVMLELVLLAHGHLNTSSETSKIWADGVLMVPWVVVGNAGEIRGSKVTPPRFKTPNRPWENRGLESGLHEAAVPQLP